MHVRLAEINGLCQSPRMRFPRIFRATNAATVAIFEPPFLTEMVVKCAWVTAITIFYAVFMQRHFLFFGAIRLEFGSAINARNK